jgi:hypothetical protein
VSEAERPDTMPDQYFMLEEHSLSERGERGEQAEDGGEHGRSDHKGAVG